jgi:hypothetical protein
MLARAAAMARWDWDVLLLNLFREKDLPDPMVTAVEHRDFRSRISDLKIRSVCR